MCCSVCCSASCSHTTHSLNFTGAPTHQHTQVPCVLQFLAVCSGVLRCVAVCCSMLQCVAVCVAVWCSVLQCVLQCVMQSYTRFTSFCRHAHTPTHIGPVCVAVSCGVLWCATVCCSVLQCVLQCVAVCYEDMNTIKFLLPARPHTPHIYIS